MGCLAKSENIEYLWHHATDFLQSFANVLENTGLLNKNLCDDLDIIDEGHSKGNISQLCLYSAMLRSILAEY